MLLGSGNLLDKLPLTQVGGVINNTNWMNPSIAMVGIDTFDKKSSLPNGYGGKAFYLPMKAGGISGYSNTLSAQYANGANGSSDNLSTQDATISGTVGMIGSSDCVLSATSTIMALAIANGDITLLCSVSGAVSAALKGSGNSLCLSTQDGTIVGAVNGAGNSNAIITINADMVGIFEGYGNSNSILTLGIATLDGKANAVISIQTTSTQTGDVKANGFMNGSNTAVDGALTAKDVWEYYQRTLTSGGSGASFTLDEIATSVWDKVIQ